MPGPPQLWQGGIEATHCPTQANQGFPLSASEFLHYSPVSRDRGRALSWGSVQMQQQAIQTPILSRLHFLRMFTAIFSACRHMVCKTERLIRPQIRFNLAKESEKSCLLVWIPVLCKACLSSSPRGYFGAAQSCSPGRRQEGICNPHLHSEAAALVLPRFHYGASG